MPPLPRNNHNDKKKKQNNEYHFGVPARNHPDLWRKGRMPQWARRDQLTLALDEQFPGRHPTQQDKDSEDCVAVEDTNENHYHSETASSPLHHKDEEEPLHHHPVFGFFAPVTQDLLGIFLAQGNDDSGDDLDPRVFDRPHNRKYSVARRTRSRTASVATRTRSHKNKETTTTATTRAKTKMAGTKRRRHDSKASIQQSKKRRGSAIPTC